MLLNYQIGSYNPSPSNASLNPSVRLDQIEIEGQSGLKTYDYVPITPESLDRAKGLDKGASGADVKITNPLSQNNIQHISKHTIQGISQQAEYLTDAQLSEKLQKSTFFNPQWSDEQVNQYVEKAYNDLLSKEKLGLNTYSIGGETIEVFIHPDGTFGSAYGNYKLTIKDIR